MDHVHIVALSGGKDSTALALRLAETEPREYTFICTPTGDELPEMIDHWLSLGEKLGSRIVPISCGSSLESLVIRQRALPNWRMRWCTRMLKIEPFEAYVISHQPCTVYVGIRADEVNREGVAYETLGDVTRRYPLVEWGWNKACVVGYLAERDVVIPERTDCGACFFQTLTEWHRLWREHPDRYLRYEAWEAFTGHTLRSAQRDTWPAALAALRIRFESGDIPKGRKLSVRGQSCSVCAR